MINMLPGSRHVAIYHRYLNSMNLFVEESRCLRTSSIVLADRDKIDLRRVDDIVPWERGFSVVPYSVVAH